MKYKNIYKTCVLAVGLLGLSLGEGQAQCTPYLTISQTVQAGEAIYPKAQYALTANNTIANGGHATYQAGNDIFLGEGFYVAEGGSFYIRLVPCETEPQIQPSDEAQLDFMLLPNPAKTQVTLQGKLKAEGKVQLIISDMQAGVVKLWEAQSQAKAYQVSFSVADLKPGIYLCTLQTANGSVSKRLIIKE